jgi:hypothetical protein
MHTFHAQRPSSRHGLTVLEFVGCLIAVVGGLWLGALYLGIDIPSAAYTALSESQLLDKMPEGWRPHPPKDKAMTREQLVSTLREELGSLRSEITALRTGNSPSSTGDTLNAAMNPASPTKERTLAYWARLNEIALGETALQEDAESAFDADKAAKVFAVKGRISRFAAKSVEAVPTAGVDEAAVRFGRALGLWYNHGGELYENAVRIWETPIGPQARTQLNLEWKQAEEQYRNEARLLTQKATAVRGSVSRIYGEEFPDFAKPIKVEN